MRGLVDFVGNWPWTSIVNGQLNFWVISWTLSIKHGHCPRHMDIGHVTWTLAITHGQFALNQLFQITIKYKILLTVIN
jgi:hypothetical protein